MLVFLGQTAPFGHLHFFGECTSAQRPELSFSAERHHHLPAAQALLEEYETSGDVGEAARCLRELGVPSYHHELVRRTLAAAFAAPKHAPALRALLAALAGSGQITQVCPCTGVQQRGALASCAPCSALAQRSIAGLEDMYAGCKTVPVGPWKE